MKLIIQIPCFNEESQLPATLCDLPRKIAGVDEVEWLVVDDGSRDNTLAVARRFGADHIVRLTNNKGLAVAFAAGVDACLKLGADIIVTTDADNHYPGAEIRRLIEPILLGHADMVVANRQIDSRKQFSPLKRRLQLLGSAVVRGASDTALPDATSGFRAYSREAAIQLQVVSSFTYTLETIIQAGKNLVAIDHVPVRTNHQLRESRLFGSMWTYIRRNALAIVRIYAMYEPLRVFLAIAALLATAGAAVWIRYLYYYIAGLGPSHTQSLLVGAVFFLAALQLAALGIVADIIAAGRTLEQRTLERVRRLELALGVEPSHYEAVSAPHRSATTEAAPRAGAEAHERETVGL